MTIVTWLVMGVLMGWAVSVFVGTDSQEGLIRNIAVGAAGACLGSWLLRSTIESASQNGFSFGLVIASSIGAVALLLLVDRLRRA